MGRKDRVVVMKKCLVIRWCAYGDAFYMLPALEALRKDYDYLHLETGTRGYTLFEHNPIFHKVTSFDVTKYDPKNRIDAAALRWKSLEEANDWDLVVNFIGCMEVSCMADDNRDEFFYSREHRRKIFGGRNFYDSHFERIGYPVPSPFNTGTIYFTEEILAWMNTWRKRHSEDFIIAMPVNGSTPQKFPQYLRELALEIRASFPTAKFVLMGLEGSEQFGFTLESGGILQSAGKWPYMQSLALMKMADYVIGPETGLLAGAGLFGTPKSMLCTSAGVSTVTTHHANDFSVQSTAPCSPCYRGIYNPELCNWREHKLGMMPECNYVTNFARIMEGVQFAWNCKVSGVREQAERFDGPGFGSLPEMRPLLDYKTDRHEEVRLGVLP